MDTARRDAGSGASRGRSVASTAAGGPRHRGAEAPPWYYANNSSAAGGAPADDVQREQERARRGRKVERYERRSLLWEVSGLERVRKCGRVAVDAGGSVGLRIAGGRAGYSGLATCGSVWACPVCASKIARQRSDDLGHVLSWAVGEGQTVAMLTLTGRHHKGQPLRALWDTIVKAWASVTSGRPWQRIRDAWGLLGFVRVIEVTHGAEHGWHPHLHVVLVLEGEQTRECVEKLGEAIWPRWLRALERRGLTALRAPGLDIRTSADDVAEGIAAYFVKSLAAEATHGHAKHGRGGGRTPFQILADFGATGDADDLALWREWEEVSKGRRQLTWSQGLRELAGLAAEQSDEEIAEMDLGTDDVLVMDAQTWRAVAPVQVHLLIAAERFGLPGARGWLRTRGLPWKEHAGGGSPDDGESPTP